MLLQSPGKAGASSPAPSLGPRDLRVRVLISSVEDIENETAIRSKERKKIGERTSSEENGTLDHLLKSEKNAKRDRGGMRDDLRLLHELVDFLGNQGQGEEIEEVRYLAGDKL